MVVIGGLTGGDKDNGVPDFWDKGIGVYDLTELHWNTMYDAAAAPYVTPEIVRQYNDEHPYPKEFSDSVVEGWFKQQGMCTHHHLFELSNG